MKLRVFIKVNTINVTRKCKMSCRVSSDAINNYRIIVSMIQKYKEVDELTGFCMILSEYRIGNEELCFFLLSRERGRIYINNDFTKERIRNILTICDYIIHLVAKNMELLN